MQVKIAGEKSITAQASMIVGEERVGRFTATEKDFDPECDSVVD